MTAVSLSDTAEVKRLLNNGADPNQWVLGLTPVMEASRLGNRELVEVLIAGGARADVVREDGWTPLMSLAFRSGDPEIGKVLIDAGAKICQRTDFEEFDNARASDVAMRSGHQVLGDLLQEVERSCKE